MPPCQSDRSATAAIKLTLQVAASLGTGQQRGSGLRALFKHSIYLAYSASFAHSDKLSTDHGQVDT